MKARSAVIRGFRDYPDSATLHPGYKLFEKLGIYPLSAGMQPPRKTAEA
jgi:hypothetical protein